MLLFLSWTVLFIGVLLAMLRLPQSAYLGELAYVGLIAVGFMGLNSALFVAMSVSVPKDKSASALTSYYLVQQLGMMAGVISTASLTQSTFRSQLVKKLAGDPNWKEVSDADATTSEKKIVETPYLIVPDNSECPPG